MKPFIVVLIAALALPGQLAAQVVDDPQVWRAFAEKLDPGTTVKIRLRGGERFKATVLDVSEESLTVQPKTRAPVPPQIVPFTDVRALEIDRGHGASVGKAVAIGVASAVGAFFALLAITFALVGD